jgi:DNA-binding NtrC family response regulator
MVNWRSHVGTVSTDTSALDRADEPVAGLRLVIEESGRPPRVIYLAQGLDHRVGRDEGLEITLDDARVSRVHAIIHFDGQRITLRDLDSSNGTFVGERRVTTPVVVAPGELIRAGTTRIVAVPRQSVGPVHDSTGPVVGDVASGGDVVAHDPASVALFALVRRLAASDLPVLVQGETGTGKEVVARALHRYSPRAGGPFIALNCGTLPESLAESELFGHERGSFTGAVARKIGVFEAANRGTLLLDEVGELSAANQTRLLRALQERVIVRLGATHPTSIDVRVVAATNRDLLLDVSRGRFREDLYFRLNGVTISVPALRSRPLDVMPLVDRIVREHGEGYFLGPGVAAVLQSHSWPGNVRELIHAMECAIALAEGDEIRVEHLPPAVRGELSAPSSRDDASLKTRIDEIERRAIITALEHAGGNQSRAARELGISRRALIYKLERYGLKPRPNGET